MGAWWSDARASWTRRIVMTATLVALAAGILTPVQSAGAMPTSVPAEAAPSQIVQMADLSKFNPGNIISNSVFFNEDTMTQSQIQSFLEKKVPACRSGYTCLKDWYDTSRSTSADAMCGAYSGGVKERAARIIFKVAQACGINPRVILVMLQKEQGLVTHTWPSNWRYTIAMGQGCPDTAACDTRYYGFFNQVYGAAWQLKRYANPPGTSQFFTWYAPGKTWNVLYHPNRDCGSAPVYVQNQATANLYYYTPYQPNSAALRAGYGEGNSCSSYGNRNFFNYFSDWFGSLQGNPCEVLSASTEATKAYVVTADSAVARIAPSRECTSSSTTLARGTAVRAVAVTSDGEWIKVNVESRDLWVLRSSVDYATSSQAACVLPSTNSASRTYVVAVGNAVARSLPNVSCGSATTSAVPSGTVATATAVTDAGDWVKLTVPGGRLWVARDEVRYAAAEETACAIPAGVEAASRSYLVAPGGTAVRRGPAEACTVDASALRSGVGFTATGVTADGKWLTFASSTGEAAWVARDDVVYASSTDVCDLGAVEGAASRTYAVAVSGVVGRTEPSEGCAVGAVDLAAGAVAKAVAVTAEKDWVKLAFPHGQSWIPRDQLRYATVAEAACAFPADAASAQREYIVRPGGTIARVAPSTECAEGTTGLRAGAAFTATKVSADRAWLMFASPAGEMWVPRADVAYASAVDACDLGAAEVSAQRTYVVTGTGVVGRTAPSESCAPGAVDLAPGIVAKAVKATAQKDWVELVFAKGRLWVPRDQLRFASTAEGACALPTTFDAARRDYVVLAGGTTARIAPSTACSTGATSVPAGTALTATGVTADKTWLMYTAPDGRSLWIRRTAVTYR